MTVKRCPGFLHCPGQPKPRRGVPSIVLITTTTRTTAEHNLNPAHYAGTPGNVSPVAVPAFFVAPESSREPARGCNRICVAPARSRLGLNYNLNRKTATVGAMSCAFTMPENGNTRNGHKRNRLGDTGNRSPEPGTTQPDTTPRDSIGQRLTAWNSGRGKNRTTRNRIAMRCAKCRKPRKRGMMPEPADCLSCPREISKRPKWRFGPDCQTPSRGKSEQKISSLFGGSISKRGFVQTRF